MLISFSYGVGFILFRFTDILGTSSLYATMIGIAPHIAFIWAIACLWAVIHTLIGWKPASLLGFSAWVFAAICYVIAGNWVVLFAVAVPNMLFWLWQHTH